MGMYDSFIIRCPKCKRNLEFQSKSGPCMLMRCTPQDLPMEIAIGINGDVVECQFCQINWKLECDIPSVVSVSLIKTEEKEHYPGNYNEKLPKNIKRMKELRKILHGN
jgi:hypothetical protein